MGAWGYKLYDDDLALDIRESYLSSLQKGVNVQEITQRLMNEYDGANFDIDETPIFWFVLADTQWDNGILEEKVKEEAIYYIDSGINLNRWKESAPSLVEKRKIVLENLKSKLLSPQPLKKRSAPKPYKCQWKIGDVYAYPLLGDYAKEKGLYGRYFLFYKISESLWHPNHTIPVVWIKLSKDTSLPKSSKEFNELEYVQTDAQNDDRPVYQEYLKRQLLKNTPVEQKRDEMGELPIYRFALVNTSKRAIPKQLQYVGNYTDILEPQRDNLPISDVEIPSFIWRFLEKNLIDRYICFNLRQAPRYFKKNK